MMPNYAYSTDGDKVSLFRYGNNGELIPISFDQEVYDQLVAAERNPDRGPVIEFSGELPEEEQEG